MHPISSLTVLAGLAMSVSVAHAQAQVFAPGDRVDAYLGGTMWAACVVVKHNVKQGDYEVQCPGKPDNPRVGDDPEHIRPTTAAGRATTAANVAQQAAMNAPRADIDANLRAVTLGRGGQPLTGLYLQLKPMMGNAASGRVEWDYYFFWADGRMCEVLPPTGTDPADYEAMRRLRPRLCGRYIFTASRMTIDVPDTRAAVDHGVSRFDGTNFVMDGYPTVRVMAFPAGTTLVGTWQGTKLEPYVRQVWTLRGDGTFTLDETPAGYAGPPARHLQGRYSLHGNTLDLGSERHTIFPQGAGKAGRLIIDGRDMDPG